jgi:hypothetical protein
MITLRLSSLTALVLLASSASAAEVTGVLAVSDPPGPSPELAEHARAFRSALAANARDVLPAEELRARMEGRSSTLSLSELDRAYAGAVAATQAGDYERSVRTLRAVIEDLERRPPTEDGFAQWNRAMLRLARAEESLGRKGEAREVMERLLRANPTASADPELFPPSFARQLDAVRIDLRSKPRRKLQVTTGGRPARVFVEGRFVGDAPVTVQLAPGVYRVAATLGELAAVPMTTDLTLEDQTAALDLSVLETLRASAGPGLAVPEAKRSTAVVAAGAFLRLDRIFAVSLATSGDVRYLVGSVYDVPKGMVGREGRVRIAAAAPAQEALNALAAFLVTGEASSLVIAKAPPSLKPTPPPEPVPTRGTSASSDWNRDVLRWSPVATAGLTVALGGVAIWQAMVANDRYSEADSMLQSNGTLPVGSDPARYADLQSQGDSAKRNAWIAGGGAVVALGATAALSYFSYTKTGEIGPFRF